MNLYLWHSSGSIFYFSVLGIFVVMILNFMLIMNREIFNMKMYFCIEIPMLSGSGSILSFSIFSIWLFLLLNLQGTLGGSSFMYDSGGLVFSLTCTVILSIMIEKFTCNFTDFWSSILPAQSPLWLASFIVIMEIFSSFIRIFTLGVRMLANLMVGQILLYLWISVFCYMGVYFSSCFTLLMSSSFLNLYLGMMAWSVFIIYSLAFCYESFVYLFQSYLFGCLMIYYSQEAQMSKMIKL